MFFFWVHLVFTIPPAKNESANKMGEKNRKPLPQHAYENQDK